MKKNYVFIVASLLFIQLAFPQKVEIPTSGGGEFKFQNSSSECLSDEKRNELKLQIKKNVDDLKSRGILSENRLQPLVHPLFNTPITKNPSSEYNNVWGISNHVDHNPNFPNQLQDWNCGTRTYDTSGGYNHKGIDYFTWPFGLYMMDNDEAWAVAAAPGIITYKADGNYDRNCAFNSLNWNVVVIQHSDGSESWYGHLKNGSLTTKNIGETVEQGEFLGVIGSSGNSTGPHLHFEVYNTASQLVDTYQGACNNWTSGTDSWWQTQKPYFEPKINAVLTHYAVPQFNNCPTSENPNLSNDFLVGSNVIAAVYLADQLAGSSVTLTLRRPDNSIQYNWNFALADLYYSSWWYWTFPANELTQQGTYRFTASYQGNTFTHNFNYGSLGNDEVFEQKFEIFPNPVEDNLSISIKDNSAIKEVKIYDILGKLVLTETFENYEINVSSLTKGIYVLKIITNDGDFSTKIVKQ